MNIARLLARSAAAFPEWPALADGEQPVATYREFFERSQRLASTLRKRYKVQAGERVGFYCVNHPLLLEAMYAVWIAGGVVVPINAKLHPREARYILENSSAVACWIDAGHRHQGDGETPACPELDIDAIADYRDTTTLAMERRASDDLAWLFYTSGTTGRPKGTMLSHGNLLQATLAFMAEVQAVQPHDVLLHAAPQSHGSGLYNFAYVARGGVNAVPVSRGFDEREVLSLTATWPGLSLFAAPTMVQRLVDAAEKDPEAAARIGTVVYGGGPMYLADIERAIKVMGYKFAQIYGQGEAPMTITALPRHVMADTSHPRYRERLASVGYSQISVEVSIRNANGEELPVGEIGDICVRGPVVMQGYWNNPDATAAALRDGWLYTGDIGVFDEDGFLTLKDRSKDVIISGATNIYPREVEEVLLMHPRVREVSVVGTFDAEWGESVLAFVVGDNVTAEELDALCLDNIARFKRPKHYRFIAELPKNNYGKVLKTALREILAKE